MARRAARSTADHGDWAVPYRPAYIADLDPHTADQHVAIPRPPLEAAVQRIVETEGPIHRQVFRRHLDELLYRSGRGTRWEEGTLERLVKEGRLIDTDDFLDIPGRPCAYARRPLPGLTKRPVEHVAPAERQRALLGLLADQPRRLSAEKTVTAAARFFGWSPTAGRAAARLMADLYQLRDTGAITGWPDELEPGAES
ncbi:hypothetical protein [Streptomyces sp. 067-1]|uniref:hypothetical protein n=1 Tax=Streptomyces sp. 067-1 TaxID=2789269 RepID=UPI0039F5FEBF